MIGSVIVAIVAAVALAAPLIAREEITTVNITARLQPPFWLANGRDGSVFGTDQLGRDVLTRLVYGARISLTVALFSVVCSTLIGVVIGLVSGYYGGFVDALAMRLVDVFLAFPGIIFTIVVIGFLGPSERNIILVLAITQWTIYARTVRGVVLSLKFREFIEAARASGARDLRIILHHVLPNCVTPIGVLASLQVATMILLESALSFLGLGVQPPTPSWGIMISDGRQYLDSAWWISTVPGVAIVVTVLGVKFLSDGISSVLDPRGRR
jgi:peptide/nickel transport system permease protein